MHEQWQNTFWEIVQQHEIAKSLKEASLSKNLGKWTEVLTGAVVSTCKAIGWQATAKGHKSKILPISRSEYLTMDVMAFANDEKKWKFPKAVFELENKENEKYIAYSLWKALCVRADLRVIFCYRHNSVEGAPLVRLLTEDVIGSMDLNARITLKGETLIVVGSRNDSETFPYGFFKWWKLNTNIGQFNLI